MKKTKRLFSLIITFLIIINSSYTQDTKAFLLESPTDWRLEQMSFPFSFAPEINYKGFEEIRFAPGVFDTLSPTYFTYIFAVKIFNKNEINKSEIYTFLLEYYRGLCQTVAESKQMKVNTSKIGVGITKVETDKTIYHAQVLFFDVFTNGQEVKLNIELEAFPDEDGRSMVLFALVSPLKKNAEIWKELYKIKMNNNF